MPRHVSAFSALEAYEGLRCSSAVQDVAHVPTPGKPLVVGANAAAIYPDENNDVVELPTSMVQARSTSSSDENSTAPTNSKLSLLTNFPLEDMALYVEGRNGDGR
jgi:hypothetical protein